jgi:hypothetical protein
MNFQKLGQSQRLVHRGRAKGQNIKSKKVHGEFCTLLF